ncbi:MAG TPA: AsmA family protein [Xanthobacteraceae bacterium]|nr:AsmA family protein [Xanthobacteraceae bacterium]
MTAAKGLKRLAIAVAALGAAGFALLIGMSFLIPASTVRDGVKKEIQEVTGLDPTLRGGISVSLFPHASVSFHDVLLGDVGAGKPAVAADEMTARLRYFPLLAGRIEIADVTLVRPTVNVTFTADGRSNWSGLAASLAHAVAPNPSRAASFSEIGIRDGTVVVHTAGSALPEQLDDVNFQVAWPSISRSFAANGRFVWRDQPVEASLTLSDFLAALTGQSSGVKLRVTSTPLNVGFDGTGSDDPTLKMEGTLNVDSPSLRDALFWTGNSKVPFGGFKRFALRAQSSVGNGTISLTDVNVELDGNRAEGVLTLAADDHRAVQGTLAADTLDLTTYVAGTRLMATDERTWDRLPITLDGLADFNLDLRLSAASIKLGDAQLGRTAVAVNMRDGKLKVAIGESQAFGGTATGSFGLDAANGGVEVTSHVELSEVDLANCLGQMFGVHRLQGHGTLNLDLEGSGNSVWAVTHTLGGTASLNAHDGGLTGINVEQLLRRLEKRPLSGNGDFRTGRTPFDQLVLNVKIEQGNVSVQNLQIKGPSVRLTLGGQASIPARDVDLQGTATLVSTNSADEFDLPFVVQGLWDDPLILPDASSLIRRSHAAAPLLDAVRRHSADDAVRTVIDQLFATPATTPAPVATTPAAATSTAPVATTPAAVAAPVPPPASR